MNSSCIDDWINLPFPDNIPYIPDEYRICELTCLSNLKTCTPHVWSCHLLNIITIITSVFQTAILSFFLLRFFLNEGRTITTKKLIYIFAIVVGVLHFLRFVFLTKHFPFWGLGALYIDKLFVMWPNPALFAMFSLLLSFWSRLVDNKNSFKVRNSTKILIIFNLFSFLFFTFDALMTVFDFENVFYIDAILGITSLCMGIGCLIQGARVYKLLKFLNVPTSRGEIQHQKLQRKFTKLTIWSSIGLVSLFIVVTAGSLIKGLIDSFGYCQMHSLVFIMLEKVLIGIICAPLSTTRKKGSNSKNSNNSASPGNSIELKKEISFQPGDEKVSSSNDTSDSIDTMTVDSAPTFIRVSPREENAISESELSEHADEPSESSKV